MASHPVHQDRITGGLSGTVAALLLALTSLAGTPLSAEAGDPTGACCSPTGSCLVTTEAMCDAGGREYQGDGTTCDPNPCEALTGACCFPDFSCLILGIAECAAAWGIFAGDGVPCEPTPCTEPIGACCLVGAFCAMSNEENCFFGDGDYQGDGTSCETMPCDPTASIGDGRDPLADLAATGLYVSLPNPNPTTGPVQFALELAASASVRIQTLDATGRAIHEESMWLQSGRNAWTWPALDGAGQRLSTGVYYLRVLARGSGVGGVSANRTILLTK